jgi:basic membrane protein A
MIKRGDIVVYDVVKGVAEGRFTGGLRMFGLKEDGLDYVREGPHAAGIPDAVKARVAALREDVVAGRIVLENK